jgi:hypothetical protein
VCFVDGLVAESHDDEAGQTGGHVAFDFDEAAFKAE